MDVFRCSPTAHHSFSQFLEQVVSPDSETPLRDIIKDMQEIASKNNQKHWFKEKMTSAEEVATSMWRSRQQVNGHVLVSDIISIALDHNCESFMEVLVENFELPVLASLLAAEVFWCRTD